MACRRSGVQVPSAPPLRKRTFEIGFSIKNFEDIGDSERVPNRDFSLSSILKLESKECLRVAIILEFPKLESCSQIPVYAFAYIEIYYLKYFSRFELENL